ncbi:ABC transporter ATP-binding protein [Kaustia mangrovi]|uniref:ABC transporter ATP-binding protein n=1 Tax=Kaustia mangrovi TaxID=2593653 RepID=A0A7S8C4C1_9HYPH|nr:ABC transporter ATP-binding protein [Kaustia mangrovi]QPC43163.1 ABC transporter ATP-binding protein [Kaustia mangrovi]
MADAILTLEGLEKNFGALKVTDSLWLDVKPGELHAVIGPNGAGKTTLIGQISGALQPDAGRVLFKGEDITAEPMHARTQKGLARSFQITTILPDFTVLENVALAVQAREGHSFHFFRPAARDDTLNEPALAALDRVGLGERAAVRAGALSHGEKRRLELAIAIATAPELLLLDEPMAGAGHEESDALVETLRSLRGHYAIVLVEHDMRAVFALADRISVLVYGRVIATGTPDEIRRDPEVRKAYLGSEAA